MQKSALKFFESILAAPSPSGYEQPAAKIWRHYIKDISDEVKSDYHGNSIAGLNIKNKQRIMFSGHIDELGFIVNYINEKGFVYFRTIGGHDRSIISGRDVIIINAKGDVRGVTGKKAIHLLTPDERKKVPEIEQIWIDIGVSSKEEAEKLISVGDPIIYDVKVNYINEKIMTSRAFDDKAGAFAVAYALKLIDVNKLNCAVYGVATVQEEVGLRGAATSSYEIDPSIGIAVDVTHATDHPEIDTRKEGEISLGGGPVILRGANANPKVVDLLIKCARKKNIPFQMEAYGGATGTDANAIQLTRSGVAAALVSIPLRYMHTPREIVHIDDIENTAKLLAAFAESVKNVDDFLLD